MNIKLLDPYCKPYKKYVHDAGWDLKARAAAVIAPGETRLIPSGVCVDIPTGCMGIIAARSSASRESLQIAGVVDPGYSSEVQIITHNAGRRAYHVRQYDRLAQLLVFRQPLEAYSLQVVDKLPEYDAPEVRGAQGFGSTGR